MDVLQKLFGGAARVKLLRLFILNPRQSFTLKEASERLLLKEAEAKRELAEFVKMGMLKRSNAKVPRFSLSEAFEYAQPLRTMLLSAPKQGGLLLKRVKGVGSLKLLILSGAFMSGDGSLDILVVGDSIRENKLREQVRRTESEVGLELRYASLSTRDFHYRLTMNDHLLRDVLDYPHHIVLDRLNIGSN